MHDTPLNVRAIPAFSDNYLWLIDNGTSAVVVDPGDATPVINTLNKLGLSLSAILITHHHPDHIGGISPLLEHWQVPVVGPDSRHIPAITQTVRDGDSIDVLGKPAQVIEVPGHTLDHIAYHFSGEQTVCLDPAYSAASPALFCGDTLFAGGCGRVFEGTFEQMHHSLARLKPLPHNTRIYCAHEYTQANLSFALAVEPGNELLTQRADTVNRLRAEQIATVPSTLDDEMATNPFLRCDQPMVISAAQRKSGESTLTENQVFAALREWKDNF